MSFEAQREAARARVAELVRAFQHNRDDYLRPDYNETQARTDFITPLLEAFGWDVHNVSGQPLALREVIEEATVEVGDERLSKRPDYELRLARQRKMFIEAKKPSIAIDHNRAAAFQTRRYGYSASLPISILTNFHQLAVYDCQPVPADTDATHVARVLLISYSEYEQRFDELWSLLSRETVYSGAFDKNYGVRATRHGTNQFDDLFLEQVRHWRGLLANDIYSNSPGLSADELTYSVQLFLTRIVFLRICEDRDIEKYQTLKNLNSEATFDSLMDELKRADQFYDSGLFRLLDDSGLGIRISDKTLQEIINHLYYPLSPYTFAVVEAEVLGEIYEQFLGDVITISNGTIEIVSKPEVRESGGVFPTPRFISDAIVERALGHAIRGKSPNDLLGFTISDICCGSGIFLLSAYEFLLDYHLSWYIENNFTEHIGHRIYEYAAGQWRLTFEEKRRILIAHFRGVDIDPNAVEVAQFSLLLMLIEDESAAALNDFVSKHKMPALPALDSNIRCGNSLINPAEWRAAGQPISLELSKKVNPFTWQEEFPNEMNAGGFNIIIGNPPYIRIQKMTNYSPEEVSFYQNPRSPYTTARQDNFDKYSLFIERALTLVNEGGRIGFIVPHKFMNIQSGRTLRRLLTANRFIDEMIHFGVKQVFGPGTSNYTCIIILDRTGCDSIRLEQPGPIEIWRYSKRGIVNEMHVAELGEDSWSFANSETRALFERVRAACPNPLGKISDIFVGVQTSADAVFIFHSVSESETMVSLSWDSRNWPIEKELLRPCLYDVPLTAFSPPQPNAWIIFPYTLVANNKGKIKARLIQPDEMANHYPGCWNYLNARRAELERRNITGGPADEQQWYQYGRSQSLTKFNSPKIILPILSTEPRYTYDNTNIMVTGGGNGPYYMVQAHQIDEISNYYLLALLNHPLSEAFVRTNTSTFRGGYYSHGKQFIENLPIPIPSRAELAMIDDLVINLIKAIADIKTARTPHIRNINERRAADIKSQIEDFISNLFGLTQEDMEVIRAVPIPD